MKYYHIAICFFVLALCLFSAKTALAQTLIRDTEIETYLQQWFAPIYEASNKDPSQVDIILIQDNDVNAFVAGGANIFFYTGLLQKTDNPGEVVAVMAHELGHIDGGHLIRGREAMENASYESIIGMILGLGAAIATGEGGAAATLSTGANSMAQRRFLSTSRRFESSADQAAIRSMVKAGINPSGMQTFLEKLQSQELAPASQQSAYVRTHPLTRDRVEAIAARIQETSLKDKPLPENWIEQHGRMNAKLLGFIQPERVEWTYDVRDTSLNAIYARAIAAYRQNKMTESLKHIDDLLIREPQNPYFHELKGQILVDFGRINDGKTSYEKALAIKPDAPLFRVALAHAQIETAGRDANALDQAIGNLKRAEIKEKRSPRLHRLLAVAYGRKGEEAKAKLHLAEEAVLQQKFDYAKDQANVALQGLKEGTPDWIRAKDILNFIDQRKG